MNITTEELEDRAIALLAVADHRRLPWQPGVRGLPEGDPVAMIGYLAELLELDFFLALDPGTDLADPRPL